MPRLGPLLVLLACDLTTAYTSFRLTVTDSVTGVSITSGLRCALYDEGNAVVGSSVSSADGCTLTPPSCFGATCPAVFRARVEKDSYYPLELPGLKLRGSSGAHAIQMQLSPKLALAAATKEFRVVLSWGRAHPDLDSYLLVPAEAPGGKPECTVNWQNDRCQGTAATDRAELDVDDTSYYGPETTTMKNPHPGQYAYLVHIYNQGSMCWDTSGIKAKVEVWSGAKGGLLKSLTQPLENPPDKCTGASAKEPTCHAYWHVFNLDATTNTCTSPPRPQRPLFLATYGPHLARCLAPRRTTPHYTACTSKTHL